MAAEAVVVLVIVNVTRCYVFKGARGGCEHVAHTSGTLVRVKPILWTDSSRTIGRPLRGDNIVCCLSI